jgi:initiation factor 1A
MVKNVSGGSNNKKFARKNTAPSGRTNSKLRVVEEDGEIYAVVTKIFGGKMCQVQCIDGKTRACIIRGKFAGRGKRDNFISTGTWVLVGAREWEDSAKENQKCDLLEIYSDNDRKKLQSSVDANWIALAISDGSLASTKFNGVTDDIFSSAASEEYNTLMTNLLHAPVIGANSDGGNPALHGNINEDDLIDIDAI